jgi:DNA-binding transcriptional MerR regulator
MSNYRIGEAAQAVGVATSTLRYYEEIELIARPDRGGNGYRTYDDADLSRMRFITNAKRLGLPLDDIRDLVDAYEIEDCSTVAHQMVERVAAHLAETQAKIGELVALAGDLQGVAARLSVAPTAGPCGDDCPCGTTTVTRSDERTAVPLVLTARPDDPTAIVCTLDSASVGDRVADWQAVAARATRRDAIDDGIALQLPGDPTLLAEVSRLAAAEADCCAFFDFTVRVTNAGVRLEVRAPDDAQPVVAAMFGAAA